MAKLDRLQEELIMQRQLLIMAVAVSLTIIGWVATNLHQHWMLITAALASFVATMILAVLLRKYFYQLLQEVDGV